MEKTAAVVQAPITFLDETGVQVSLPPSLFWFVGASLVVDQDKLPVSEQAKPGLVRWLTYLSRTGVITAAPADAQPARPSMVLQARRPGSAGNDIELEVTYADPPKTFTLKVTQTDLYTDLTLETLSGVLGTQGRSGTRPGLVRVQGTPTALPTAQTGQLVGADATSRGTWTAAATSGAAFTLEASEPGAETIDVAIGSLAAPTFSLQARWQKSVSGLEASNLEAELTKVGYVLTPRRPADGYALPRAGRFQLGGGVDGAFASFVPAARSP